MAWNGWYATDGSMNVTVVSGSSLTGTMAADGSVNVIASPGNTWAGAYHPCGALYVTVQTSGQSSIRAPDGSLNISQSSYQEGTQPVTVVSGSFGGGNGALVPIIIF